eukprot:TRINITY_DN598_c4_g1_i1.p1 TRINITY_DN598_c4_g1~~TRINITY_DN598_c4_g1_i1.p1  ORF type:complete len:346 (+),score=69.70 TRINITY_DN598_c4_g1_i1:99-1136(+)
MGGGNSKKSQSQRLSSSPNLNTINNSEEGSSTGEGNPTDHNGLMLSKEVIDFGNTSCPLNEIVLDQFVLTNNSAKKIKFKVESVTPATCKISFLPATGQLPAKKKNATPSRKIDVKLQMLQPEALNFRVNLRVNNETLFLTVKAHPDKGVFGVDPTALTQAEDDGFEVPEIIVEMKNYLVSKDAFNQEGIFRLAGDAVEMKQLKDQINAGKKFPKDIDGIDVNSVANLLKVWFRDLPVPILNVLPTPTILRANERDVVIDSFEKELVSPQKDLLGWLLNILVVVAVNKGNTKMSEQNLAIVVAPNLYDPPSANPMEGLVMSQKATQYLHNLLLSELENRGEIKKK